MAQATTETRDYSGYIFYTRSGGREIEQPFEKPVIVPTAENQDPAAHAWADARFAIDIMAEHALFFALLMPPETAGEERKEALRFNQVFTNLYQQIDANPPNSSELKNFVSKITEEIKP